MTTIKLLPLSYKIVMDDCWGRTTVTVSGFAIDTAIARLCVRKTEYGCWIADDYDTGYRIGARFDDRDKCINAAIEIVAAHIATGRYAVCQKSALEGLAKAGLI